MPIPLLLAAAPAIAQSVMGGVQALTSGRKARERELEQLAGQSPLYKGNKSIEDYYGEALSRYKESPYQSKQYQEAAKAAGMTTAAGLGAMQDRRGALGAVSRLSAIQNQAMANAGVAAEQQRNQRFGQLGGATQMKTAEDYRKFDINQMTPYQRKLQLSQYKAQAANERQRAGLQTLSSGLSNLASVGMGGIGKKGVNTNVDYSIPTIPIERPRLQSVMNKTMQINPNAQPMRFNVTPKYLQAPTASNYDFSTNSGKNWWEQ